MRNRLLLIIFFTCFTFPPFAQSENTFKYKPSCQQGVSKTATISNTPHRPLDAETPASFACVYGLTPYISGCRIRDTKITPGGGSGVIVLTEGGDDPYALQELNGFSKEFKIPEMPECTSINPPSPAPCFAVVYATESGNAPKPASGKDLREHAIDIEMAHAMAPNASIIMVEAQSFSQKYDPYPYIFDAVHCANQILSNLGGGIISNSWSIPEYAGETKNDIYFQTPGIVYVGSSGDELAPAHYPPSSPYIVSVGGTEIVRDDKGDFVKEISWNDKGKGSSGGPSIYEPRPAFQNSVMKIVGNARGTPDISTIGHNIVFYHIDECTKNAPLKCQAHWLSSSGTSFAAPIMAGIINRANSHAASSEEELLIIYNNALKNYHAYWHDIIEGTNGFPTLQGYDFVTGLGTPLGYLGK